MNKSRILIIDDEEDFSSLLKENLEEMANYEVQQCNSSELALSMAREFQPHLCIIDVVMPGMDGGDIVSQFRADSVLQHVPVMMLTALVEEDPDSPDGEMMTGGLPFLSKTSSLDRVLVCIEKHLAENKLRV